MAHGGGGPLIARGSLAIWEREQRARLAAAEQDAELARMRTEMAGWPDDRLALALKLLKDLRKSRGYRLMRLLGRWESLDQGIQRVLK